MTKRLTKGKSPGITLEILRAVAKNKIPVTQEWYEQLAAASGSDKVSPEYFDLVVSPGDEEHRPVFFRQHPDLTAKDRYITPGVWPVLGPAKKGKKINAAD